MMPTVPDCRNCGAPLSKTSLEAFVPSCDHCGTPIMGIGGVLGLTSAFEKDDPTLNRTLIENDLEIYRDHIKKYNGLIITSKQQLDWSVERYAKFPSPPELLEVETVPSVRDAVSVGSSICPKLIIPVFFLILIVGNIFQPDLPPLFDTIFNGFIWLAIIFFIISPVVSALLSYPVGLLICLWNRSRIMAANGNKPLENARRQRVYDKARAAALKVAESIKDAEDHRLRRLIVEAEGKIMMAERKVEELRKILAKI